MRRERVFDVGAELFCDEPIDLVRGEEVHLYDADGRRYLDLYNNVPCVGHCHPHVVEAMPRQASTLNIHGRYLHEGVIEHSERLVAKHAKGLDRLIISCTGSEASEVGDHLKRARAKIECPAKGDVRGWGLLLGMEWVSDRAEKTPDRDGPRRVVNQLKDKGFLIGTSGSHDATRKVRPPVVFGRDHADAFLAAFEETVRGLH